MKQMKEGDIYNEIEYGKKFKTLMLNISYNTLEINKGLNLKKN